MTDPRVRPILALGLAGLEHAKALFVHRLLWHAATLAFLVVAACAVTFLHGKENEGLVFGIECAAAFLAVVTEFLALRAHHHALHAHSLGRQVMRRVMLLDARRPGDAAIYLAYVEPQFSEAVRKAAQLRIANDAAPGPSQNQLDRYYYSEQSPGNGRLRDHLLESAMFSERLYAYGWQISALILAGFVSVAVVVIGVMMSHGVAPGHVWGQFAVRALIALLAFIPASQELDHALLYRMMSERLQKLIGRIEHLWRPDIPPDELELRLMADVGDYGANTTFAPPIRTWFYNRMDKGLSDIVKKRLDELNAPPAETPKP